MYKSWEDVTPQQMAKCELILTAFLTPKLDPEGHQNTFDVKFEQYRGNFMGATLHNMMKKGILWEVSNKRYQLIPRGALRTPQGDLKSPHNV